MAKPLRRSRVDLLNAAMAHEENAVTDDDELPIPEGYSRRTVGVCARDDLYWSVTSQTWRPVHGSVHFGRPVGTVPIIAPTRPEPLPEPELDEGPPPPWQPQPARPQSLPYVDPEVAEALAIASRTWEIIEHDISEEAYNIATKFFDDVLTLSTGIVSTIERTQRVTDNQLRALKNMEAGVKRWLK